MPALPSREINRPLVVAGAAFALLSVATGAFAAHGLKNVLDPYSLGLVETAARYQMYHALGLLLVAVIPATAQLSGRWLKLAALAFIFGILVFSGSLYLLALSGARWLGAITPLGGVAFILGWGALIVAASRRSG